MKEDTGEDIPVTGTSTWNDPRCEELEASGGAGLPHRDADPIMRLGAHYFSPANFMWEQFSKLDRLSSVGRGLSRSKVMDRRYYLLSWLSGLYVVMEGIETLPLDRVLRTRPLDIPEIADRIPSLLSDFAEHRDSLRKLRNAQFHYQPTSDKHVQFFDRHDRLDWAIDIHRRTKRLFSDYRVGCAVVCAISGRINEIDMKRRRHPSANFQFILDGYGHQ